MEIATFRTPSPHRSIIKSSDFILSGYNMTSLITTMKHSNSWANGELNALILLKSPDKKIILTAMHKDTEVTSYQSSASVTFQIIEGSLQFHVRKDEVTLSGGQEMTFDENESFRLTTEEETVFLLTISDNIVISRRN